MFIDASAIIAILANEPEAKDLLAKLARAPTPICSPIVRYEAVRGLARARWTATYGENSPVTPEFVLQVSDVVEGFFREFEIVEREVTSQDGFEAVRTSARFGRRTGHPARLNFGDCFSYACAKSAGVPLLFKGQDFIHTDIEAA